MKRLIIMIVCFSLLISCAGTQKNKNGKKAVKNRMKYLIAIVDEKPPESPIVMLARDNKTKIYSVGLDFDGDHMPDRVDYYKCQDDNDSPVIMEMHGAYLVNRSHKCRKVGFANWQ